MAMALTFPSLLSLLLCSLFGLGFSFSFNLKTERYQQVHSSTCQAVDEDLTTSITDIEHPHESNN